MTTEISLEMDAVRTAALPPVPVELNLQPANGALVHETRHFNISRVRSIIIVAQLSGSNFITSLGNGLVVVCLPVIASDVALHEGLLVWPMSAFYLTSGSCLLLAGSAADAIGSRVINLTGCFLLACSVLGCGFARTGVELIMLRALHGIAAALVVPSAVSIINATVEDGRPRNIGFASLGLAMPLGFSVGLVLGGIFADSIGWRASFYIGGSLSLMFLLLGIFFIPKDRRMASEISNWRRLASGVDWVGAVIASVSLAMLSFVLAMLSADIAHIKSPTNIALLCVSVALIPLFLLWMHRQEKMHRPALIPNRLWSNIAFSSICLMVLLSYAVINSMELFSSLFFQNIQQVKSLGASLRMMPNMLLGILLCVTTGILVDRVPAAWAILVSSALSAGAPLLMAVIQPDWPYWYDAFFAQLLTPISADILFTVGLLVISNVFPRNTQALAGAVFNTCAQLGSSIGLSVLSVVAASVTQHSQNDGKPSQQRLMMGYRVSFWTLFAWTLVTCFIGGVGLRNVGKALCIDNETPD